MRLIIGFPTIQSWRLFWSIRITLVLTPSGVLPNIYQVSIFPKLRKTVIKEIKNLEISESVQDPDIPVKILKENAEFFAEQICCQFKEEVFSSIFPVSLKLANITTIFKVDSRNQKDNYRPISILPIIAKTFEK